MSLDEFLDKQPAQPEDGIGLALSGGGYRAMVFHVGALIRLNEVGLMRKIKRISSVSGGSITAGVLGTSWKDLKFTFDVAVNFDVVVERVRQMADTTVDAGAIIGGILALERFLRRPVRRSVRRFGRARPTVSAPPRPPPLRRASSWPL
jgi:NTE family protein